MQALVSCSDSPALLHRQRLCGESLLPRHESICMVTGSGREEQKLRDLENIHGSVLSQVLTKSVRYKFRSCSLDSTCLRDVSEA